MSEFVMPQLGADMTRGRLVRWEKKPGDTIKRGDIIAIVETDKTNIDVESFQSGVFEQPLVEPSEKWLPVGTPLALIRVEGEALVVKEAAPARVEAEALIVKEAAPAIARAAPAAVEERVRASPSARKLADELGVDIAKVIGSGPGGRIMREDIEAAAVQAKAAPAAAPAPVEDRTARMRQAIAASMARSKREIPHYYMSHTIDMGKALSWLADTNLKRPVTDRLLYGVLLIKSVALALREVPELNAWWVEGKAQRKDGIHVGVAISLRGGGLVAPALLDADRQSLDQLMRNFLDLVQRARAGSLRSSEYSEPTITVTSLGERAVESVFGVIFPPQVALVGFGTVSERPWAFDGTVVVRPLVHATLSADHRVTDGHRGAQFLAAVERLLQTPEQL
jgi:pyruvate dehydrogenase E2 component (dihydrolipoamide acetyltransferase)